jgi:hypothetical protein
MNRTIYITTEQLRYFSMLSDKEGKRIVKHLPSSSAFKPKNGSWKSYWESKTNSSWPNPKTESDENVGCHVVDIVTQEVFIYPKPNSENSGIKDHEDERIFIVDKSLAVPFKIEDSNYEGPCESPEEHLRQALSKISFL